MSKTANIVDNWMEETNLLLGNIRILISVSKNCGHCGQLDTKDKSVIREDQILISVSKTADIVDN